MPTADELAITKARIPLDGLAFWLGPLPRGELDEAALAGAWLPTTGAGWQDLTGAVLLSAGAEIGHDGRGYTLTLTVADEARGTWADELPVAVVSTHRDLATGASLAAEVVAFGYLDGSGRQALGQGLDQTGERTVTLAGFWDRVNVPALRLGRRNLAAGASIHASTPVLATPEAEAPLEYIGQESCAATLILDGNADTVSILDSYADPARPALGDSETPIVIRVWDSRTGTLAVEVGCFHDLIAAWGNFDNPAAVPNFFESGSNTRDDASAKVEYAAGRMIVTAKANVATPNQRQGPQWNLSCGDRPIEVAFRYKAGATGSIGKKMHFVAGTSDVTLALPADWQEYVLALDRPPAQGNVLVVRFQGGDNNSPELLTDTVLEIDDFQVWVGYSDLHFQSVYGYKLSLAVDDGLGHEHVRRIAWDIAGSEEWRIPARGSVIFAYDAVAFRARYDPGARQVYQLKNVFPDWRILPNPNHTRLKLAYATNANQTDYDDAGLHTIHEILFDAANGGAAWGADQALSRQAPVGTGFLAPEDYPHVGLYGGAYGAGYWWVDLGAYPGVPLALPVAGGAATVALTDPDDFPDSGAAYLSDDGVSFDAIAYTGRDDATLTGVTGALAHTATAKAWPEVGGSRQTGWLIDLIELRRKPGTPLILAGAVLASNLLAPSDPSTPHVVTGGKWERNPDWTLLQRWDTRSGDPATITIVPPGGVVQARHLCVVIDRMERARGLPQRAKLNELVVYQHKPGASGAGGWAGRGQADTGGVLAHLLTRYGDVPASKVALAGPTAPTGDLPIAPTTLRTAIEGLERTGLVRVWCDPLGAVTVAPDPASPRYDQPPAVTFDASMVVGDVRVTWATAHQVAQVVATAREVATFRTHTIRYPSRPGRLGRVVELKDVAVRSAQEAREVTEAAFRGGNARRRYSFTTGAARWARPYLRCVVNFPDLDASGQHVGVNCYVASFRHRVTIDEGGVNWQTDWELAELPL